MGMKSVFCVIFSLVAAVGVSARAEGIDVTSGNFESYRALKDGNTYRFVESVTFAAPSGESALKVADGATVTLNIPSGVTVTLTGGSANGVTGAGAGIEVPASATLNIIGAGKLIAYGGDAASGTDGEQGTTPASYNDSTAQSTAASGGKGGNGGGGAGAGIGGRGGNGGNGGAGGESFTDKWNAYQRSGNSGKAGAAGDDGASCGAVVIHETVTVFAIGGAAGANGSGGDKRDWCPSVGKSYYWAAYGSGGGGGGGGGSSASDIGGGGAGGGGAGGGGGSGLSWDSSVADIISYKKNGLGGAGGYGEGSSVGGRGKDRAGESVTYDGTTAQTETKYDDDKNHYSGGAGGSGGAAGKRGDNGSATVKDSAVAIAEEVGYSVGRISDTEYVFWKQGKLYRVKDGASTNMTYTVVTGDTGLMDSNKWYVVKGMVSRSKIGVNGTANLVLLNGASITVQGGKNEPGILVSLGNTLNIFGTETGSLTVQGGDFGAGIGGGYEGAGGIVTVNGGTVTATGGNSGAGIGGGWHGDGGNVTINGGTVTATGGDGGAGIGGGNGGAGGDVTINGGEVTAQGGVHGSGIGGGQKGKGGTITVNGGTVTATGGGRGAGIGGGYEGAGGTVTINGGTVTATGGKYGAGIGGGWDGDGGTVTINGGTVTAIGRDGGRGIGGGDAKGGGAVSITGGTVRAEGWDALGETVVLGDNVFAYDITGGEPGTLITEETLLTSVDKILAVYDAPVGPTCEGGEIELVNGVWVITPNAGVTAVTIANLSEGAKVVVPPTVTRVSGVADAQIKVRSGAYDITGAFTVTGGAIQLNENGAVTIGGETIPVKPTIGDLDEGEPFMVDKGVVMVAVRAIPGLRYALVRGETVEGCRRDGGSTEEGGGTVIESVVATGTRVALSDANPPEGGAFYVISVSCPAAVVPSDSTIRIVGGRVYSGQYDITDAVTILDDGTVELKAGGVVGGVKVTPVIGELPPSSDSVDDAASPLFLVGAELTFETIPGLCYGLLRGETSDKVDEVVDWRRAESGTMTLKDFNPPEGGAFYRIVVKIEEF